MRPVKMESIADALDRAEGRSRNPGLIHSIEINQARFGYGDEMARLLRNTAERYLS